MCFFSPYDEPWECVDQDGNMSTTMGACRPKWGYVDEIGEYIGTSSRHHNAARRHVGLRSGNSRPQGNDNLNHINSGTSVLRQRSMTASAERTLPAPPLADAVTEPLRERGRSALAGVPFTAVSPEGW